MRRATIGYWLAGAAMAIAGAGLAHAQESKDERPPPPIIPPRTEQDFRVPPPAPPDCSELEVNWACPSDYPRRALREEREGTAFFRVLVGLDGRVKQCWITTSSGHADLDEATCANITRRARFKPATDGEGNPIEGYWSNSVRWVIPE